MPPKKVTLTLTILLEHGIVAKPIKIVALNYIAMFQFLKELCQVNLNGFEKFS